MLLHEHRAYDWRHPTFLVLSRVSPDAQLNDGYEDRVRFLRTNQTSHDELTNNKCTTAQCSKRSVLYPSLGFSLVKLLRVARLNTLPRLRARQSFEFKLAMYPGECFCVLQARVPPTLALIVTAWTTRVSHPVCIATLSSLARFVQ